MRVVITGMGIISPVGNDLETYWQALISGHSGVGLIHDCCLSRLNCHFAGQVCNLNIKGFLNTREVRRMDRFCQFAIIAAKNAWNDSGRNSIKGPHENTGVIFGTGIGGISTWDNRLIPNSDSGEKTGMDAFTIPRIMNNAAAAQIAMQLNLKGMNITVNTACSAGANAIGMAFREIRAGNLDCIICGGAEAPITPKILKAWDILGVLSKENTKNAVRPFDKNRTGFVLAEGAAAVVLESLNSAARHNRKIYAEIIGFGSNCDAHHLTSPAKAGQVKAIRLALNDAGIKAKKIDYINAHGTATKLNDRVETYAIKEVFENFAHHIPISSTKSMLGHAMGASSAMEIVVTALSVKNNVIHPTLNYQEPDPECDLDYVPGKARIKTINHALSNSFGFGGSNAVLVVKKWKN
ncbi:MAG: beta-ketoacyl-[acyl-carrier-protein] synthase family protein [Proteobacteria bacterium]|nr:beta-ketoacyl-[acyl-carrier-protein] synthase family protein [Pseudomonadota bacterium]MBU1585696.1 beta-ketoacyl-[acyl-carrier-protein] synthase family protein [Pseudomonadota bacterium]MBU2452139.1 beta-ketoacyl-[acyl-carrier-protein] synthase family protein [Pseudomonadota bacterium]MBU2629211.1 beta-ketoacyl-[acyl-carrier-protein] synthase family protein [Pseudomonadota bacterium]